MPLRKGALFQRDERAAIGWYDLFVFFKPLLEKIYKRVKDEFVFITLWHDHRNAYIYHIHPPLRKEMYDYLKGDNILKKFGLLFGNDQLLNEKRRLIDIGIYAFLPFHEICRRYPEGEVEGKKIIKICEVFATNVEKNNPAGISSAVEAARLLIKFALEKCGDKNFSEMLIGKNKEFAQSYNEFYGMVKDGPWLDISLSRFLKGSFRGMYISSEGFVGLAISTKAKELKDQGEQVASKISREALRRVQKFEKLEVFQKLFAVFSPKEKREKVAEALESYPYMSVIMTDKARYRKLIALFDAFKKQLYGFDFEIRESFNADAPFYYRVPIIVNVYRDDNSEKIRSVCAGINDDLLLPGGRFGVQQIKYSMAKFALAKKRCIGIVDRYFCRQTKNPLPSEKSP